MLDNPPSAYSAAILSFSVQRIIPNVFEFLGVPENKPMLESDLEQALVQQIEKFLLELGRGFMFVGTQQLRLSKSDIESSSQ